MPQRTRAPGGAVIPLSYRMAGIDAAWLHMERRTNPMIIVGVVVLAEPLELGALKRLVAERWLVHARLRAVPVEESIGGRWIEDPYFEIDAHVGPLYLPGSGSQADLEALASELASQGLDPRRPRWRFDLVPVFGAGSALIIRIHHCYADGIALVRLFLGLTTSAPGAPLAASELALEHAHGSADGPLPWLPALLAPASAWLGETLGEGAALLETGLKQALNPTATFAEAKHAAGMAAELASLVNLPDDPPSPLKGPLGAQKRVAWAKPLPLEEVRTVAHALGCTVNDVLMASIAGCLGEYLRSRGQATAGLTLRAALPVNLRPAGEPAALGNRFGLVVLELPVGIRHPLKRVYAVHTAMRTLKDSPQPMAAFVLLSALGHLPEALETLAIDTLSRKASAVVSNVPGPAEPLYLSDRRIAAMYFWVPQSGSIGLGISLLSYAGEVQVGAIADRGLIAEPHAIVDGLAGEFERLLLLTLLGAAHTRRTVSRARPAPTRRRAAPSHPPG